MQLINTIAKNFQDFCIMLPPFDTRWPQGRIQEKTRHGSAYGGVAIDSDFHARKSRNGFTESLTILGVAPSQINFGILRR